MKKAAAPKASIYRHWLAPQVKTGSFLNIFTVKQLFPLFSSIPFYELLPDRSRDETFSDFRSFLLTSRLYGERSRDCLLLLLLLLLLFLLLWLRNFSGIHIFLKIILLTNGPSVTLYLLYENTDHL